MATYLSLHHYPQWFRDEMLGQPLPFLGESEKERDRERPTERERESKILLVVKILDVKVSDLCIWGEGEVVLWWSFEEQETRTFCQGPDNQKSLLSLLVSNHTRR